MVEQHTKQSRQTDAYACLAITFFAALLCMALRLAARRVTKVPLWYDDWLGIIAFMFAMVWSGLLIWWLQSGFGLFLIEIDMPVDQVLERSKLILWNAEIFYAFSLAFSKLSILAFYWRMFKNSNIKKPIIVLFVSAIVWLILRTFMAIFHCVPVQAFWKSNVKGTCNINDSKFFFGTVLAHLIIDIAILILPIMQIRKLQLPITKKAAVIAMFMFGFFVCIASIVVLSESLKYDTSSPEMAWNVAPIIIWATAEVNLAIVSACLPMLRPIWLLATRHSLSKGTSSGNNGPYAAQSSDMFTHQASAGGKELGTITINKKSRASDEEGDGDSTYKLASSSHREGSISDNSDYHGYTHDGNLHGPSTVITGQNRSGEDRDAEESWAGIGGMRGIVVTNEIGVRVSRAK
ncbi:hypothetical protein BU16DRAFT_544240 [Lophium mytilinum]|uniref:Rhodopsin domain-containing protein n=1 Tax=Lophium mytilinum TaxID=390894 RepID=A0A6A6QBW5_9PEZI|nr:hypothetical protein BU16DRAFT_544240 [Lophium mytilinum]